MVVQLHGKRVMPLYPKSLVKYQIAIFVGYMKVPIIETEKHWWRLALVLGLFAFALYANTIPNSYALDDELVTRNHPLTSQGIKAIPEIFTSYYYDNKIGNYYEYRPVVLASFAIEHQFFGDNVHISHAINAFLYGLLCMVLLFVLRSFVPGSHWLFPALATLLFAAHPIHTEVVASIKNRDEIFSLLFGLLALFWSIKYARKGTATQWLLFLVFMLLSVMSKRSVLSYTVIIPLAACWFSQASLLRLLSLSFPLMLIVLFFSPIHEKEINALIIGAIISFPVVFWCIKTLLTHGPSGITVPARAAFFSVFNNKETEHTAKPIAAPKPAGGSIFLPLVALVLLAMGSLIALYLDLRMLMWICLAILTLSTFVLRPALKGYPIVLGLLVVGLVSVNFQLHVVVYGVFGLLLGIGVFGGIPAFARFLAPGLAIMVGAIYLFTVPHLQDTFIDLAVMAAILVAHNFIKNKRVIPILLLAMGIMKLIAEPQYAIIWQMNILGAAFLFLQWRQKLTIAFYTLFVGLGVVALFALAIFPLQPQNPIYERNLGAYYANLPDPYGDGEKTVTSVVPGAGRQVDFVENPLVAEKNLGVKLATASKVMGYYTYLLVAPVQLRFYYGFNQIEVVGLSSPVAIISLLGYLVLLVLGFWLYQRDALLSFALLYLLFGLLFVSNLGVLLTGIVAERLVFGTSLGYCMLLALLLFRLFKLNYWEQVVYQRFTVPFLVLVVTIVGLYTTRTIVRNTNWKSKLALYHHDAAISPNSAKVQQLLGNEYLNMGLRDDRNQTKYFAEAEKYLKNAIAVAPRFHSALLDLGHLYSIQQDCNNALIYLERFMAVSSPPPLTLFHYAVCLDVAGRFKEAVIYYERYINADPYFVAGYSNLSYLYFRIGEIDKALATAKRGIQVLPGEPDSYINAGTIYLEIKQPIEALPFLEKAYELRQNDLNLSLQLWDVHTQLGNTERGQFFYGRAKQLGYKN